MKTIRLRYTNCFLINHSKGWLMVDTGYEFENDRLLAGLSRHGVGPEDLTHIFLTLHHDDHAGLLHGLTEKNPQIRVLFSRKTAKWLPGGSPYDQPGPKTWL